MRGYKSEEGHPDERRSSREPATDDMAYKGAPEGNHSEGAGHSEEGIHQPGVCRLALDESMRGAEVVP